MQPCGAFICILIYIYIYMLLNRFGSTLFDYSAQLWRPQSYQSPSERHISFIFCSLIFDKKHIYVRYTRAEPILNKHGYIFRRKNVFWRKRREWYAHSAHSGVRNVQKNITLRSLKKQRNVYVNLISKKYKFDAHLFCAPWRSRRQDFDFFPVIHLKTKSS